MTAITPFVFENEHVVRVVEIDGEPWFAGSSAATFAAPSISPMRAKPSHAWTMTKNGS